MSFSTPGTKKFQGKNAHYQCTKRHNVWDFSTPPPVSISGSATHTQTFHIHFLKFFHNYFLNIFVIYFFISLISAVLCPLLIPHMHTRIHVRVHAHLPHRNRIFFYFYYFYFIIYLISALLIPHMHTRAHHISYIHYYISLVMYGTNQKRLKYVSIPFVFVL